MLALLGMLVAIIVLAYVSFALIFTMLHGGEEFSPLPIKQYWWMLPVVCGVIYLWDLLFAQISITISIL
jgi:hypothetical protein